MADVGGTNVRLALVTAPAAAPSEVRSYRCAGFPTLQDAALAYLDELGLAATARPAVAAFALATAVGGDVFRMTNSPWTISRPEIRRALGASEVHLLNDFEALAYALPHLTAADLQAIGSGARDPRLPMAVIGPGTGLGVAGCVPTGDHWQALASEGGHATLAAVDAFEAVVLEFARREFAHVSAERLLSGIGLPLLHLAVAHANGRSAGLLTPEAISRGALQEDDADCVATLSTFCSMLGGFAGNVALTLGARGGVFVAGGIAQKLGRFFIESHFRERFVAKGRFEPYLKAIGTSLITAPTAALVGAAHSIAVMGAGQQHR